VEIIGVCLFLWDIWDILLLLVGLVGGIVEKDNVNVFCNVNF
jgi:hypothetical protein